MNATRSKLGTFGGVFTPSILTILGLILFLRLGFVVGSGGVLQALGILVLATAIASLTSVSLAAIATNRRVRGGGDYYLISRSLGVAYGGALGLILFVAQAVSVGFYCVGFAEGVSGLLPEIAAIHEGLVAVAAAVALLSLAYLGADLATRFQYLIMATLGAALASFFVGAADRFDGATLAANWSPDADALGFWVLFAIFFPAVTGFTQGVSMSGDLRDPARSLPRGTFLAVGLSMLVYAVVVLLLGGALPAAELAADGTAMKGIAAAAEGHQRRRFAASVGAELARRDVVAQELSGAVNLCLNRCGLHCSEPPFVNRIVRVHSSYGLIVVADPPSIPLVLDSNFNPVQTTHLFIHVGRALR